MPTAYVADNMAGIRRAKYIFILGIIWVQFNIATSSTNSTDVSTASEDTTDEWLITDSPAVATGSTEISSPQDTEAPLEMSTEEFLEPNTTVGLPPIPPDPPGNMSTVPYAEPSTTVGLPPIPPDPPGEMSTVPNAEPNTTVDMPLTSPAPPGEMSTSPYAEPNTTVDMPQTPPAPPGEMSTAPYTEPSAPPSTAPPEMSTAPYTGPSAPPSTAPPEISTAPYTGPSAPPSTAPPEISTAPYTGPSAPPSTAPPEMSTAPHTEPSAPPSTAPPEMSTTPYTGPSAPPSTAPPEMSTAPYTGTSAPPSTAPTQPAKISTAPPTVPITTAEAMTTHPITQARTTGIPTTHEPTTPEPELPLYPMGTYLFHGQTMPKRPIYVNYGFPVVEKVCYTYRSWFSNKEKTSCYKQNVRHKEIYVSVDGYVSFGTRWISSRPVNLKQVSNVSMVAPFWTKAYATEGSQVASNLFRRGTLKGDNLQATSEVFGRVTTDVEKFLGTKDFVPKWILVLTWDKVRQTNSPNDPATNTYQLVLATDYYISFSLFLYKTNGMKYDPDKSSLPAVGARFKGHTIQPRFSRKREAFGSDKLLFHPRTDVKGMYAMRLDRAYRYKDYVAPLECIRWYLDTTKPSADVIRYQNDDIIPTCPCTYFQALLDTRWRRGAFKYSSHDTYEIWRIVRCFVSAGYDWNEPFGRECCYEIISLRVGAYTFALHSSWLTSNPKYTGSFLWTNPYSGNWNYWEGWETSPWYKWYKNDVQPQRDCCSESNLCTLFQESHPLSVSCVGKNGMYMPPGIAIIFTDPHITTIDLLDYTFNGYAEYVMLNLYNKTSNVVDMSIHCRTDRVRDEKGELQDATILSAFAVKDFIGNVSVQVELSDSRKKMSVMVNGVDYTGKFDADDEFAVENVRGISVTRPENTTFTATLFSNGVGMNFSVALEMLSIAVTLPQELLQKYSTKGLLGVVDGDKTNDLMLPNGTVISPNSTEKEVYYNFGSLWKITPQESVFVYPKGQKAEDFDHSDTFKPKFIEDYPAADITKAKAICGDNKNCQLDYLITNSSTIADSAKAIDEGNKEANKIAGNIVPNITGDAVVQATVGSQVQISVQVSDPDGDPITVNITSALPGTYSISAVVGGTATIQWTPDASATKGVTFSVMADDGKGGISSTLDVTVVLCPGCNSNGACNFSISTPEDAEDNEIVLEGDAAKANFHLLRCHCNTGYTGETCTIDFDGCGSSKPCPEGSNCIDLTPAQEQVAGKTYRCEGCPPGLQLIDDMCLDINECANASLNLCNHKCTNIEASFECSCRDGFRLIGAHTCQDVDECAEQIAKCKQVCTNTDGSFKCSCKPGFLLASDEYSCNKDPSAQVPSCAKNCSFECDSSLSPPACFCPAGFNLAADAVSCVDIDECAAKTHTCNQKCINDNGSYHCSCLSGFSLANDKRTCTECDDAHWGDNCANECGCADNTDRCDRIRGCICESGWKGAKCDVDIDECLQSDLADCQPTERCENNDGGYQCVCRDGYKSVNNTCTDVDECADKNANNCTEVEVCSNVPGTYTCTCARGYKRVGALCENINECDLNIHGCEHECIDKPGFFNCECYDGFILDDDRKSCIDKLNKCANITTCDSVSTVCVVIVNVTLCNCKPGFNNSNGTHCSNIDECSLGQLCSHTCIDNPGGYSCSCPNGFSLQNGITCVECDAYHWGPNCGNVCGCDPEGSTQCNSTTGCVCKPGWTGSKCADDVAECTVKNGTVCNGSNEFCTELRGSYRCDCDPGYRLTNGSCIDIDECTELTHHCAHTCTNTNGSFTCACTSGFIDTRGNGTVCENENECATNNGGCAHNCVDNHGSFLCTCNDGYTLNADRANCTICSADRWGGNCANECNCTAANTVSCNNTIGCVCKPGYEGRFCESDINECTSARHNCVASQMCINSPGSFSCKCRYGYVNASGVCTDVNECTTAHECAQDCTNTPGAYTCSCRAGSTLGADNLTCVEDNTVTCQKNCSYACDKTSGSEVCYCKQNDVLQSDGLTCKENKMKYEIQLTIDTTANLADPVEYAQTKFEISEALKNLHKGDNIGGIIVNNITQGSLIVNYFVVFKTPVSLSTATSVQETLRNVYLNGSLVLGGSLVNIVGVPQFIAQSNGTIESFDVTDNMTCSWSPCNVGDTCLDINGTVVCIVADVPTTPVAPTTTTTSSVKILVETKDDTALIVGLSVGLGLLFIIVVVVIVLFVVHKKKQQKKKEGSRVFSFREGAATSRSHRSKTPELLAEMFNNRVSPSQPENTVD